MAEERKSLYDAWDEICDKIDKIFTEVNEEDHPKLAEHIAIVVAMNGGNTIYEGIGILDVAKRNYEKYSISDDEQEDGHRIKIITPN
jgi:hypothetical protein